MKVDFHMHSQYSNDGELSVQQIIEKIKEKDIKMFAITDHNNIDAQKEAIQLAKENNITYIPGIELCAQVDGNYTHILGLNIDPNTSIFDHQVQRLKEALENAVKKQIILCKKELGATYDIDQQVIKCLAHPTNAYMPLYDELLYNPDNAHIKILDPYRPNGNRSDLPTVNLYWDLFTKGNPLYVPIEYPDYRDIISIIHEQNGIAIIAHPFTVYYQKEDLLEKMIEAGIDGIECYSNYHNEEQNEYYYDYATKHNLLVSVGSDFHGKFKPHIELGEYGLKNQEPSDITEKLIQRLITK
ncbi:MAG: PHP domain-containing protein [Erysipelotrichaceae bacterium]